MLFQVEIFFALLATIAAVPDVFQNASPEEINQFFGTSDGIVPEYHLVNIKSPLRQKRSIDNQLTLKLNISGLLTPHTLNLVTDQYLMGQGPKIYDARSGPGGVEHFSDIYTLPAIGPISFYHNSAEGSALTYFHKDNVFSGVIKHNFMLKALPKKSVDGIIIPEGSDAVRLRSNLPLHVLFQINDIGHIRHHDFNTNSGSHVDRNYHQEPNTVYPKILVAVDPVTIAKYNFDNLGYVKYLISFINVVDAIYRALGTPKVRLNLAAIVIPKSGGAADYIKPYGYSLETINGDHTLEAMRKECANSTPVSSIPCAISHDIFVTLSSRFMQAEGGQAIAGQAWYSACDNGVVLSTFNPSYGGVGTLAHELAHTMGVRHDELTHCPDSDGFLMGGISAGTRNTRKVLHFSQCSQEQLATFFRSKERASCLIHPPKGTTPSAADLIDDARRGQAPTMLDGLCKVWYRPQFMACKGDASDICQKFTCLPDCSTPAHEYYDAPSDGVVCGDGKHCQNGRCVQAP